MSRSIWRWSAPLAFALVLVGCGGGGSGGGTAAPPIAVPSPAPTPTPTPSPASPSYRSVFDFGVDLSVETPFAEVRTISKYNDASPTFYDLVSVTSTLRGEDRAATIDYSASTSTVTISAAGEISKFNANELTTKSEDTLRFQRAFTNETRGGGYLVTRPPTSTYRYISASRQDERYTETLSNTPTTSYSIERYLLVGSRTSIGDIPAEGAVTHSVMLFTSSATDGAGGLAANGSLATNFATGTISGTLNASQVSSVNGSTPISATLTFTGTFDRFNNRFSGRITSSDSGYVGDFTGRLFGPRGVELGFVFTLARDGRGLAGQLLGMAG